MNDNFVKIKHFVIFVCYGAVQKMYQHKHILIMLMKLSDTFYHCKLKCFFIPSMQTLKVIVWRNIYSSTSSLLEREERGEACFVKYGCEFTPVAPDVVNIPRPPSRKPIMLYMYCLPVYLFNIEICENGM